MKLPISLLLAAVATAATAQTVTEPTGDGPRGSSQVAAGEIRYDEVGYAGVGGLPGMSAASIALAPGSFAEITALDSGKTILVMLSGAAADPGQLVTLSATAAAALGITAPAGVRVRRVTPTPQDASLLTNGDLASGRSDAPAVLLVPLRKKLAAVPVAKPAARPAKVAGKPNASAKPDASAPRAVTPPKPPTAPRQQPSASGAYLVQLATLSDAGRAQVLATKAGGRVVANGKLFRVQTGPFADRAAAVRGQAAVAKLGYRDAQIIPNIK